MIKRLVVVRLAAGKQGVHGRPGVDHVSKGDLVWLNAFAGAYRSRQTDDGLSKQCIKSPGRPPGGTVGRTHPTTTRADDESGVVGFRPADGRVWMWRILAGMLWQRAVLNLPSGVTRTVGGECYLPLKQCHADSVKRLRLRAGPLELPPTAEPRI